MSILQWDPDGTEDYTIFTGVVTIDPTHNMQDETVNAWVVAASPNAETVTAILPRCRLPEVLRVRTGKEEGLLVATPFNRTTYHEEAANLMAESIRHTLYGDRSNAGRSVRFSVDHTIYLDDHREPTISRESE